jgi:hypothetical protein
MSISAIETNDDDIFDFDVSNDSLIKELESDLIGGLSVILESFGLTWSESMNFCQVKDKITKYFIDAANTPSRLHIWYQLDPLVTGCIELDEKLISITKDWIKLNEILKDDNLSSKSIEILIEKVVCLDVDSRILIEDSRKVEQLALEILLQYGCENVIDEELAEDQEEVIVDDIYHKLDVIEQQVRDKLEKLGKRVELYK